MSVSVRVMVKKKSQKGPEILHTVFSNWVNALITLWALNLMKSIMEFQSSRPIFQGKSSTLGYSFCAFWVMGLVYKKIVYF